MDRPGNEGGDALGWAEGSGGLHSPGCLRRLCIPDSTQGEPNPRNLTTVSDNYGRAVRRAGSRRSEPCCPRARIASPFAACPPGSIYGSALSSKGPRRKRDSDASEKREKHRGEHIDSRRDQQKQKASPVHPRLAAQHRAGPYCVQQRVREDGAFCCYLIKFKSFLLVS